MRSSTAAVALAGVLATSSPLQTLQIGSALAANQHVQVSYATRSETGVIAVSRSVDPAPIDLSVAHIDEQGQIETVPDRNESIAVQATAGLALLGASCVSAAISAFAPWDGIVDFSAGAAFFGLVILSGAATRYRTGQ